ncbi:jg19835 [Pararge aegeria aegeria]|uniref:Jg19835 protein n=1 Tax=Pararge aegeria aegeria TaxID=348720 RepID=A0A8S4SCI1_9NEOP|nr:jg19835 [Pararge aegeria aegeria]
MKKSDEPDNKPEGEHTNGVYEDETEQKNTSLSNLLITPYKTCHNINDLKMLDFNSADEVRQAMKSILSGTGPDPNDIQDNLVPLVNKNDLKGLPEAMPGAFPKKMNTQKDNTKSRHRTRKSERIMVRSKQTRRRASSPSKAGPSSLVQRQRISAFYNGKLYTSRQRRRLPKRLR